MNGTAQRPDTDEYGYPVDHDHGVRCGNHGRQKIYHTDIATVRYCFELRRSQEAEQAAEIEAERALERKLEDAGWAEARAQEDWEERNGVIDFQTAWALADAEMEAMVQAGEREEDERVAAAKLARDGFNEFGQQLDSTWSSADRERAQACRGAQPTRPEPVKVEAGMYRNPQTDEIFKVQVAVHGSGQLYAKLLERLDVPKTLKNGKVRTHAFRYVPGAVRKLRPEWRMTLEQCQEFGALYGTCVRCGLTLTKEESIERRMGDVCYGKASQGIW